jgi:hypothetical protein
MMRWLLLISLLGSISLSVHAQDPDFRIAGRVFDESNRGVERVRVCALPIDYAKVGHMSCAFSDANGNFVIVTGRPSQYRILPDKSPAGYHWQREEFWRNPVLSRLDVNLTERNPSANISVPLGEKNGLLTGRVLDAGTNQPIENVKFMMCHVANPRLCASVIVKTTDGVFNVDTPHVPFTLKVSADGYEEWWAPNGISGNNTMTVAPGERIALPCLLSRKQSAADRTLSETDKQPLNNLPAPLLLSPADRAEFNEYPRHTTLEWQPVEGADHYLVEIDYCDGRNRDLRECLDPLPFSNGSRQVGPIKVQGTSYEFDFIGRQPGRWRVWAVDSKQVEGFKSPWRVFFYLK